MALKKFKNCAVDVDEITFVSANTILFENCQRIEVIDEQFADVIEYFLPAEIHYRQPTE